MVQHFLPGVPGEGGDGLPPRQLDLLQRRRLLRQLAHAQTQQGALLHSELPGEAGIAAAHRLALPAAQPQQPVRGAAGEGDAALGMEHHAGVGAADVFRPKALFLPADAAVAPVAPLAAHLQRQAPAEGGVPAAPDLHHPFRPFPGHPDGDGDAHPADLLFPAGKAEAEAHPALLAAAGKDAVPYPVYGELQPFAPLHGQHIPAPGGQGALPGIFVPEEAQPALPGETAEALVAQKMAPAPGRQGAADGELHTLLRPLTPGGLGAPGDCGKG